MKKTLYTLAVNNYAPEITKLTFPLLKLWAKKMGAEFYVITERKFPTFPCPYEKFQIKELAKKRGDEWSIFIDADALVKPEMWDPTEFVGKETTISNTSDFIGMRFKPDKYFKRDGRWIGKGNWLMMASDWCTDVWSPLEDLTPAEAASRITVTVPEASTVIEPYHLIDDFTVSRNIARYGLKHVGLHQLRAMYAQHLNIEPGYMFHWYLTNTEEKVFLMKKELMSWAILGLEVAEGALGNPEIPATKQAILSMNYKNDKDIDWQEFLAVLPEGKRVAGLIKSWGIPFELANPKNLSKGMKKRLMMAAVATLPDSPQKMQAAQIVNSWDGNPKWQDFLGALEVGPYMANMIKDRFGVEVLVMPKTPEVYPTKQVESVK